MIRQIKFLPALILSVVLLACASGTKRVGSELVLPDLADRIVVNPKQKFLFPGEFGLLPDPVFPSDFESPQALDITVCLSFVVDETGSVVDVKQETFAGKPCIDFGEHSEFFDAAKNAVRTWEFIAGALCEYSTEQEAALDDSDCRDALSVAAIPVRLAWAFRFVADKHSRRIQSGRQPS